MARQFLNVVMPGPSCGGSLMSRIVNPVKHLFYPSTAEALRHLQIQPEAPLEEEEVYDGVLRLPPPKIKFIPSWEWDYEEKVYGGASGPGFFPLYGGGRWNDSENRILRIDRASMTSLYHADSGAVQLMPSLAETKMGWDPYHIVSLCVTTAGAAGYLKDPDVLYVMDSMSTSFQALAYGDPDQPMSLRHTGCRNVWHWRPLPPPPVIFGDGDSFSDSCSYAVLHGKEDGSKSNSTILVSFRRPCLGKGTYCFNTGKGKWSKAGGWTLPFLSHALHVPELGNYLLFGIDKKHFLAVNIYDAVNTTNKWGPVLRHTWIDVDIDPLSEWRLQDHSVAYLGDGRFCIHRTFDVMETDGWGSGNDLVDTVLLITGVEVVRDESGGLQMIKHKSRCLDSFIDYVL